MTNIYKNIGFRALLVALGLIALAACSDDPEVSAGSESGDIQTIAVTTDILTDVVSNLVGDQFEVEQIMPSGVDPHLFQPSAQQIAALTEADLVISNGGAFEEGLIDILEENEEDTPTLEVLDSVNPIEFAGSDDEHSDEEVHSDEEKEEEGHDHSDEENDEDGHDHSEDEEDDHSEDDHSDEEKDEDGHDQEDKHHHHSGLDPHFFNDAGRVALGAEAIVEFIEANSDVTLTNAEAYIDELTDLDAEVTEILSVVPEEGRLLVTNHEVFGYFADSYDFEVLGSLIPSGSTDSSTSSAELAEIVEKINETGVSAIFTDETADDDVVNTLLDEVEGLEVGSLFSEALGDADSGADTYIGMARTNASLIAELLS